MNCGRGSEIGITRYQDLTLKLIEEDSGKKYYTLSQYVERMKTQSKYSF